MITIIDYGSGNLRSVQKALEHVGAQTQITQNIDAIRAADKIVLPGVGAMQPAMDKLRELNLIHVIKDTIAQGKPFLGICLGLQLLFEKSEEGGEVSGLGILKGEVLKFRQLKIPQIGWNQISVKNQSPLLANIKPQSFVYFCHSYFVKPADKNIIASSTEYGIEFTSSIWKKNIFGLQFHPEKSQTIGLQILKNFVTL